MTIDILKGFAAYGVLLLLQVLVFNHIHLFGFATPLLYIYVLVLFKRNTPRWIMLVLGFLGGLLVDIFSNTPGLAAASTTFIALVQPYILLPFLSRDSAEDLQPSIRSLGFLPFSGYMLILVFIYCVLFFTLEAFTFFNWIQWINCVIGSTILTFVMLLSIENLRR